MEPSDVIIKLRVTKPGAQEEILNVHRCVLGKSSSFFQNAIKPEWAISREQPDVIDLPDDSALSVKQYNKGHDTRERTAEEAEKVFVLLAEAYIFGERILDTKYKNEVMKGVIATVKKSEWNLGSDSVNIIYKGTPPGSSLRRLVSDQVAYFAHDDSEKGAGWMRFFDGYPREALVDAIKATVRTRLPHSRNVGQHVRQHVSWYLEGEAEEVKER